MRVLKDQILHITKTFNVQQLLDFILSRMEAYYQRRCLDVANNRLNRVKQSRFFLHAAINPDTVQRLSEKEFEVTNATDGIIVY